ncbi:MAG: hypothetical protein ACFUZC_02015 [Chthoniobacteraceae bacterium]
MKSLIALFGASILGASALFASSPAPAASGKEYVVLSGGPSLMIWEKWKNPPHDLWWQNFVRAAEVRIAQLEADGANPATITWFVYQPSYVTRGRQDGKDYLGDISTRAKALGVRLRWFRSAEEVFNYLNAGQPRDRVKVADFEYFGHSNRACWMFDYSNQIDSASKVWIHEDELWQIAPQAFESKAYVKSWGCHTGESMSQKFRRRTGQRMWGAVGRTQYMTNEVPVLSDASAGKWRY